MPSEQQPPETVTTSCRGCGIEFSAPDDEGLADQVIAHIAEAHDRGHRPTVEQVLSIIRSRRDREG
jgi:predicted small metal-binding protein